MNKPLMALFLGYVFLQAMDILITSHFVGGGVYETNRILVAMGTQLPQMSLFKGATFIPLFVAFKRKDFRALYVSLIVLDAFYSFVLYHNLVTIAAAVSL